MDSAVAAFEWFLLNQMHGPRALRERERRAPEVLPPLQARAARRLDLPVLETADITALLGPPRRAVDVDRSSQRIFFTLPTWPALDFGVRATDHGAAWIEGFWRSPTSPPVHVSRAERMEPWTVTLDELPADLGATRGDSWGPWEEFIIRGRVLIFDFRLLQDVRDLTTPTNEDAR